MQVHLVQYKLTILCFLVTDVLKFSVPFFQVTLHPTYSYWLSLWRVWWYSHTHKGSSMQSAIQASHVNRNEELVNQRTWDGA